MPSTVLFDNWGLELSTWALVQIPSATNPYPHRTNLSFLNVGYSHPEITIPIWEDWIGIMALADLLESLIFFDTILFPEKCSEWWMVNQTGLGALVPFLKKVCVPAHAHDALKLIVDEIVSAHLSDNALHPVISSGSLYYLLLSQHLDIPYQPSPMRADFLSALSMFETMPESATTHIARYFNAESRRITEGLCKHMGMSHPTLHAPAVAAFIFHNATTKEDIVPLLIEIRRSKERQALLAWLEQMQQLLQSGNLTAYAREFRGVADLFRDLRVSLGLSETETASISLGISPTLDVDVSLFRRLLCRCPPRLRLLKRFVDHLFASRTYAVDVHRLFGTKNEYALQVKQYIEKSIAPTRLEHRLFDQNDTGLTNGG